MKGMVRKLVLTLAAMLYVLQGYAQQTESKPKYNFVVCFHDGGKVSYPLDAHPVVTYRDGNIVVSTTEGRVEYVHAVVNKYVIEEVVEQHPDVPTPDPTPEPEPDPIPELYFVVWLYNGARISFPFDEHPLMTYSDGDILISTSWEQLSYPHSSVRKFTLSDEDISQGETIEVDVIEREAQWQYQGDAMTFSDCAPGERVAVYNASGQLLAQYVISSDGTLQIPLQQFGEGMYIVKMQSVTYKFIKR